MVWLGYLILALGAIGLLISLERMVVLGIASRKVTAQLNSDTPSENNALGRVLSVYEENKATDTETLELKLSEAIFKETPALNRALLFIKIISVVAPLMGLLGTVTGMINTFQAITLYGTGDPKLMAGGISQALVTTVCWVWSSLSRWCCCIRSLAAAASASCRCCRNNRPALLPNMQSARVVHRPKR